MIPASFVKANSLLNDRFHLRLVNRRSTTWRKMSDTDRGKAETKQVAALLSANPTLIKRPVIIKDSLVMVGFDAATQTACRT